MKTLKFTHKVKSIFIMFVVFFNSCAVFSQASEMRVIQYNPYLDNDRPLPYGIPRRRVAISVPFDHTKPQGPKIKFEAYIWGDPSLTTEPLLIINGGPFQNATSMESMIQRLATGAFLEGGENEDLVEQMKRAWGMDGLTRPIVFFDQRGTVEQRVANGLTQNIFFDLSSQSNEQEFQIRDHQEMAHQEQNKGRIDISQGLDLMSNYSLKSIAYDIRILMNSLFPGKKADLVAHSFGGRISMKIIELFPELVRTVVNIGSVVTDDPVQFMLERERHQRELIETSQTKTAQLLRKYLSSPLVAEIHQTIEKKQLRFQINLQTRIVAVPQPLILLDRLIYEVTNSDYSPSEASYDQYMQDLHQAVTRALPGDVVEIPDGPKYSHLFESSSFQKSYFYGLGLGMSIAEIAEKTLSEARKTTASYPLSETRLLLTNSNEANRILRSFQISSDIQPDFARVNQNLNKYQIKMSTILGTRDALMPISLAKVQKQILPSVKIEVVDGGTHLSVLTSQALFKESGPLPILCQRVLGL